MEKEEKPTESELLQRVSDLPPRINEYTCSLCGKVSFQSKYISKHYRIRENYAFQKDPKFFLYDGPLTDICKCVNVMPFKCEVCHKRFAKNFLLRKHCRIHTDEKPYQCEICERSFKYRGQLDLHVITHAKGRPYKCPVCSECFARAAHFRKHCYSHTLEKGGSVLKFLTNGIKGGETKV